MRFTMAVLCLAAASAAASAVLAAENRQQLQFLQSLLSGGPKPDLSKEQWTQLLSGISKQQWVQILGNFNKAAGRSLDQEAGGRGRAGRPPRLQPRQLSLQRQLAGQCGGRCA